MMPMQKAKNNPMKYYSGIFDKYLNEPNIEHWEDFPETMWRLGYEMACSLIDKICVHEAVGRKPNRVQHFEPPA